MFDTVKSAYLRGNYILTAKTPKIQLEFMDYIERYLDNLDTIPPTELSSKDFSPFLSDNDRYRFCDIFFLLYASKISKNDCLKLINLLALKYDVLSYKFADNDDNGFYIYLQSRDC